MSVTDDPGVPRDPEALPTRRDFCRTGAGLASSFALGSCAATHPPPSPAPSPDERARLDELFSDLQDERASVEPIREPERAQRRTRASRVMRERGIDAMLIEPGATMSYLSGVSWGHSERLFALVLTADGEHFWVVPAFEEGKARLRIDGAERPGGTLVAWQEDEYPFRPLAAALRERRVERVAIEPAVRYRFADRLGAELGRERLIGGAELVAALRSTKDAHELALLRRANELTQRAIVAVSERLKPGQTAREISRMMDQAHSRLGMRSPWALVLIGPSAAYPHGDTNQVELQRGDVLLIDTGASFHDYQSDNTRTWVVDAAPTLEVEDVWNAVRDAQLKAFELLRPGVVCGDVDRVARALIDERGYGPGYRTFTHRLGHGIGMEGHEDPYFDGGSTVVLGEGMTLSDEPGIYLRDRFGVRLEDIVAITAGGADHFGSWQRTPRSPA